MRDEFLEFLRTQHLGRLKVFLGMAAGVGKTVAMLREGRRLRDEGVDVVCGYIETHGRDETAAEVAGLEVVPRCTREHRGVPLEEMDLDAVLARKPDVVLVDELAHTDVPGGRHARRYQDVEALLDGGISVLTTLNVQHLESLHDLVLRETGVDVRERVPDRVLRRVHEIVLVDLPPEDLLERLRQGKVYPPQKVERALERFFRLENLTALRQLALREMANAVEGRGRGPHPGGERGDAHRVPAGTGVVAAERVMVCMASKPSAGSALLRRAARLAGRLNSRWFAVYVRTPGEAPELIETAALRSLADNLTLARELGAEVVRLEAGDPAEALARFALEHAITHAVFGRSLVPVWRQRMFGSVLERFMRLAPDVDVLVVALRPEPGDVS